MADQAHRLYCVMVIKSLEPVHSSDRNLVDLLVVTISAYAIRCGAILVLDPLREASANSHIGLPAQQRMQD